MHSLYKEFKDTKISLGYFGALSDNITSILIDLSEGYISKTDYLSKISKKASFIITESFQNLIRHSLVDKGSIEEIQYNKDYFQINILEDRIVISSVNALKNEHVSYFKEKINHINSLDKKELRKYKLQILTDGSMSEKGGAGLGLIEMVRKSGLPLGSKFIPLNDAFSLAILNIEIPLYDDLKEHKVDVRMIEKTYKRLVDDNILILYKGDFSSDSNKNFIEMLHNNFVKGNLIQSGRVKNIMAIIEVMQNVSKHGKIVDGHKNGLFVIRIIQGNIFIECSNFVKHEEYQGLKKLLKAIKCFSKEEIEMNYKEILQDSKYSEKGDAGLGLLEIARLTENKFTYSFVETDDDEIFYSIKIKTS